jgi:DnaJ-class molecular chaperone
MQVDVIFRLSCPRRRLHDQWVESVEVRDPYEILGIGKTAPAEEIQKAYRKLAKKLHPDLNPGDRQAEADFKELSQAYGILSDPEKRRRFDQGEIDASGEEKPRQQYYRDYAPADATYGNSSGFADFAGSDSFLAELLRRQREHARRMPGADLHYTLVIDLLDAINGATRRLSLPSGGSIDVTIPAGVRDGQVIRLRGKGAPSQGEGPPGDAMIELTISPHRFFVLDGDDIRLELPVTLKEAVLGGKVKVPTPAGAVMMTIPKGSNTGTILRLRGKGAPRKSGGHGDELVVLKVMLPSSPDAGLEELVSQWSPEKEDDLRGDMLS